MNGIWDNPVARHALRPGRRGRPFWVALLLVSACVLGALLQSFWMEMPIYSFLRPQLAVRWMGFTMIAETVIALPWAAARGAILWRRLCTDGHLDEYRRTCLAPTTIAHGVLWATLRPVFVLLLGSTLLGLLAHFRSPDLEVSGVLLAHGLLAIQAISFAALGVYLSTWVRYPALAVPLAISVLVAALGGIWTLEFFYRRMSDPSPWIYAMLLPNPVTAVANVLQTDVIRFAWIYDHIHAHEYDFVYPPAWQTGGLYLLAAGLLFIGLILRIRKLES